MGLVKMVLSGKPVEVKLTPAPAVETVAVEPVVEVQPEPIAPPVTPQPEPVVPPGVTELPIVGRAENALPPAPCRAAPAAKRVTARTVTSAAKVRAAAAKLPDGTPAQIAAKAGLSESTARRYLPSPSGPVAVETPVNGKVPALAA
jgi:hypothetical protein